MAASSRAAARPAPRTLTVVEAADELGVAPARIRTLLASGALEAAAEGRVLAAAVEDLARRGVVRSMDVAAVEGALDRALRRRLPELVSGQLQTALAPLAGELATAFADVELSSSRVTAADARAASAEQALATSERRVAELEAQVSALQAQPVGLFRRRRTVAPA